MEQWKTSPLEWPDLPGDFVFRHEELRPAEWTRHSHPWGQLNYVSRGLMNLEVAGKRFVAPSHYAVWVPPALEHAWSNVASASYRTVYVAQSRCTGLPDEPCALAISTVLKAILCEFARLDVTCPSTLQHRRLAQVALDQMEAAEAIDAYLPFAVSSGLQTILQDSERTLHKRLTAEQVARAHNLTTRTLERRCSAELGIGYGEWRQRLRFTKALDALAEGQAIQKIAFDLGYKSPSAFISMFHSRCGQTPEKYRRSLTAD